MMLRFHKELFISVNSNYESKDKKKGKELKSERKIARKRQKERE